MKKIYLLCSALLVTIACTTSESKTQKEAERVAKEFSEAYFNFDLQRANKLATSETARWLSYMASNLTQEDVDLLNAQEEGASVDIEGMDILADSLCRVRLNLTHFMMLDSIGRPGVICHEGETELTLVKRDKQWLVKTRPVVKTADLPRSGMHSRD